MAKAKPRQVKIEQRGALEAMQRLEQRTDDELKRETRHKAAALAILGARAAERYDAKTAREYFRQSIAVARPQERLDQTPPSGRQLFGLRVMGLLAPPAGTGLWPRIRGILLVLALVVALLAVGFLIVELVALPFGGIPVAGAVGLGFVVVLAALGILALVGRRKQAK